MAGFRAVPVERWGGLDLRSESGEIGLNGAIDLLNVDLSRPGRVRTRDGYSLFAALTAAPSHLVALFRGTAGRLFCVQSGGTLTAINTTSGATAGTLAIGSSLALRSAVAYGNPTASYGYMGLSRLTVGAGAVVGATIRRYASGTFSAPTATVDGVAGRAMPMAEYLAVTPWDNRLVACSTTPTGGPNGAASSTSHVWFSGSSTTIDAETWTSTNYVQLTPGDGENIQGAVAWRDMLFVFKETKFFVFYGTSTDSTGAPIFNYRKVDVRAGITGPQEPGVNEPGAVVATRHGVYFGADDGVYVTTGGAPVRISDDLLPLFQGVSLPWFGGSTARSLSNLAAVDGRVFFGTGAGWFVYDEATRQWSYWNLPDSGGYAAGADTVGGTAGRLFFSYTTANIGVLSSSATTDAGVAITSRYRTGFFSPVGEATVPSTIREVLMDGTGTVDVKRSFDYGTLGAASAVSLGTSPAIVQGRAVAANYGRFHSYEFSSTTGPFTINRATFHYESKGPIGKQP